MQASQVDLPGFGSLPVTIGQQPLGVVGGSHFQGEYDL